MLIHWHRFRPFFFVFASQRKEFQISDQGLTLFCTRVRRGNGTTFVAIWRSTMQQQQQQATTTKTTTTSNNNKDNNNNNNNNLESRDFLARFPEKFLLSWRDGSNKRKFFEKRFEERFRDKLYDFALLSRASGNKDLSAFFTYVKKMWLLPKNRYKLARKGFSDLCCTWYFAKSFSWIYTIGKKEYYVTIWYFWFCFTKSF